MAPPKQQEFRLAPADNNAGLKSEADDQIGFLAYGLLIDNPTGQAWWIWNLNQYIPAYTLNIQLPILQGTQRAQIRPIAPGGVDQYATLAGQFATFRYIETSINAPFAGVQMRVQPNEIIFAGKLCLPD